MACIQLNFNARAANTGFVSRGGVFQVGVIRIQVIAVSWRGVMAYGICTSEGVYVNSEG